MVEPTPGWPTSPAAILRRLGLRPRKGLSQNFLVDRRVAVAVVRAASVTPDDEVLEVGPGLGILTRELCRHARRVVAVEIDPTLATVLQHLVTATNLEVVQGDALTFDPSPFAGPYKLAANLPYHITSPLLRHFLVEVRRPTRLVVMVQREVAERIAARPGAMSFLAVMVQLFAAPSIVRYVSPGAYFPRPKVTSAILRLDVRPTPAVPVEDRAEAFLDFVQAGFAQPRKQLRNSLAQGLRVSTAAAAALLRDAGIDPTRRPQALGIEEWWQLFQAFQASPPS